MENFHLIIVIFNFNALFVFYFSNLFIYYFILVVIDILRPTIQTIQLIDVNVFGELTDSLLFDWDELLANASAVQRGDSIPVVKSAKINKIIYLFIHSFIHRNFVILKIVSVFNEDDSN